MHKSPIQRLRLPVTWGVALLVVMLTVGTTAAQRTRISYPQPRPVVNGAVKPVPRQPFDTDPPWQPPTQSQPAPQKQPSSQWHPNSQWDPPIPKTNNVQPQGYVPPVDLMKGADEMMTLWMTIIAIAGGLGLLWFGSHVFLQWRASRDPANLAMSDPWVRARLKEEESYPSSQTGGGVTQQPGNPGEIRTS